MKFTSWKCLIFTGLKSTTCLTKLLVNLSDAFGEKYDTISDLNSSILISNTTSCDLDLKLPSEEYWS